MTIFDVQTGSALTQVLEINSPDRKTIEADKVAQFKDLLLARGVPGVGASNEHTLIQPQRFQTPTRSRPGAVESHIPYSPPYVPSMPNTPYQLTPGLGVPGNRVTGYHWQLGDLSRNANFLNNLIQFGEAYTTTPRGLYRITLNRSDNSTSWQFIEGPGALAQGELKPYRRFEKLVNELHLGNYRGSGLPEDLAKLHPELNHYLITGEMPPLYQQPSERLRSNTQPYGPPLPEQWPEKTLVPTMAPNFDEMLNQIVSNVPIKQRPAVRQALSERLAEKGINDSLAALRYVRNLHNSPQTLLSIYNRAAEIEISTWSLESVLDAAVVTLPKAERDAYRQALTEKLERSRHHKRRWCVAIPAQSAE